MRKFLVLVMLTVSAVPALAQRDGPRGDGGNRGERSAESGNDRETYRRDAGSRPDRASMPAQFERPERAERQRSDRGGDNREQARSQAVEVQREAQAPTPAQFERRRGNDGSRGDGMRRRGSESPQPSGDLSRQPAQQFGRQGQGWQQRERRVRSIPDGNVTQQVRMTSPERPASTVERRHYNRDGRGWNQRWRNDARYDWRRHRDRHRSIFRVGFYYDPFGWNYRRFGIGSYLWPSYFGSRYWINDPWQYRLPPAYGSYRWVRYHNDALLIDTWTGQVVDVIYGFFW